MKTCHKEGTVLGGCFYARFGKPHNRASSFVERFDSVTSHRMTHGLIPHKAARLTSRATRESFESLRVWVDFPMGCASNNSPGGEPGLFYIAA